MKRRTFFKNLGIGIGAALVAPQILLAEEVLKPTIPSPTSVEGVWDKSMGNGKYHGIDGSKFNIQVNRVLNVGDIITDDPEYGQQLIVYKVDEATKICQVKLVTNDFQEWWIKKPLGTELYLIAHRPIGEYDSYYMDYDRKMRLVNY